MSNLFGTGQGKTISTQAVRANGLQVQASNYGMGLPIVYGRARVAGTLIWYGDFQAVEHDQQVGKGGGGGQNVSYTYSSSFQLALCEGPIDHLGSIWKDSSLVSLSDINGTLGTGTASQAAWSHLGSPENLQYPYTCWIGCVNLLLGGAPTVPNFNFEIYGLLPFNSGGNIWDAEPSVIITDLMTSATHGIGFSYLGDLTTFRDYCVANSIFISPVIDQETTMANVLQNLLQITNSNTAWSNGKLIIIPYSDQSATGNGVTYTPPTTIQKYFTDRDYVKSVRVDRKPLADLNNVVRIEWVDPTNNYVTSVAEAKDEADISASSVRQMETIQAHAILNGTLAQQCAQQILQRALYIRNTYTFTTTMENVALEPGDVVALTDSLAELSQEPVRITQVTEQDNDELEIVCEEFPAGVAVGATQSIEAAAGFKPDFNGAPDASQPPVIFRAPQFLVDGDVEVWIGVCGSGSNWGGANILASFDNVSYTKIGSVSPGCRYGTLTQVLADSSADPDTTNSFKVALEGPGSLSGGTHAEADNLATLMIVDQELIAYSSTTLNADGTYTLGNGYMRRQCYGTAHAAHAIGAPWMRVDNNFFRWKVDPSWVGTTIYIKIQAWNLYGGGLQSEASLTPVTYVIGAAEEIPDTPPVPSSVSVVGAANGNLITWSNPNPAAVAITSVEFSTDNATWSVLGQVQGTHYTHAFTGPATYYYRLRARSPSFVWSAYATSVNATGGSTDNVSAGTGSGAVTLAAVGAQRNMIPDSGIQTPSAYWSLNNAAAAFTPGAAHADANCVLFSGTGAAWGYAGVDSIAFSVVPGATYTFSAVLTGAAFTGANPVVGIWGTQAAAWLGYVAFATTDNGTRKSVTFTVPAGNTTAYLYFDPENAVLAAGSSISFQQPQLERGSVMTAYQETVGNLGAGSVLVDLTRPGHVGRTLANIADDAGSSRYAVFSVDGNRRALIDFTQSGHVGKVIDNLADGSYARTKSIALRSGVPFAEWIGSANCSVTARSAVKTGGTNLNWDTTAFTLLGMTNIVVSGKPRSLSDNCMLGISTTPTANVNYANNNYSWYNSAGNWIIYEGGTSVGSFGAAALSDVASVLYDGIDVSYYINGVLKHQTALAGATVYGYCAFYTSGAGWNSLYVAPSTLLPSVSLDNEVADGTYQRMPAANMDDNRRAIIDFSQAGHLGKTLTNIGDDANYARIKASFTSGNQPISLAFPDTRSTNQPPSWYYTNYPQRDITEFKSGSTIGLPGSATYVALQTHVPWTDTSGGVVVQTVNSADGVYVRKGSADGTSWGAWYLSYDNQNKPNIDGDVNGSSSIGTLRELVGSVTPVTNDLGTEPWTFAKWVQLLATTPWPGNMEFDVYSTGGLVDVAIFLNSNPDGYVFRFDGRSGYARGQISKITAGTAVGIGTQMNGTASSPTLGWHNVMFRYNPNGQMYIYVDGILEVVASDTTFSASATTVYVGYEVVSGMKVAMSTFYNGFLDSNQRVSVVNGGVASQGTIAPGSSSVAFSYTSNATSVTVIWTAGTIYRSDGSATSVSAGSQQVTGLSASTTYYHAIYYDENAGSIKLVSNATYGVGSPTMACTSKNPAFAQGMLLNATSTFGWYQTATPASGSGGGGGGTGCCLNGDQTVELADGSVIEARALTTEHFLQCPSGPVAVVKLRNETWVEWFRVTLSDGTCLTVAGDHRFIDPSGEQLCARTLRLQQIVEARSTGNADFRYVSVVKLEAIWEEGEKISIEVAEPHTYYVQGILSHNKQLC